LYRIKRRHSWRSSGDKAGRALLCFGCRLKRELPAALISDAEMYADCVSGASEMDSYLGLSESQVKETTIHKQKLISLPDDLLAKYLSKDEIIDFRKKGPGSSV